MDFSSWSNSDTCRDGKYCPSCLSSEETRSQIVEQIISLFGTILAVSGNVSNCFDFRCYLQRANFTLKSSIVSVSLTLAERCPCMLTWSSLQCLKIQVMEGSLMNHKCLKNVLMHTLALPFSPCLLSSQKCVGALMAEACVTWMWRLSVKPNIQLLLLHTISQTKVWFQSYPSTK